MWRPHGSSDGTSSGRVQELTDVAADQILKVVEPPQLAVDSTGRVSWPATADGYRLEGAEDVQGPWSGVAEHFSGKVTGSV